MVFDMHIMDIIMQNTLVQMTYPSFNPAGRVGRVDQHPSLTSIYSRKQ